MAIMSAQFISRENIAIPQKVIVDLIWDSQNYILYVAGELLTTVV